MELATNFLLSIKGIGENLGKKHLQASHLLCTGTDNELQYPPFRPLGS